MRGLQSGLHFHGQKFQAHLNLRPSVDTRRNKNGQALPENHSDQPSKADSTPHFCSPAMHSSPSAQIPSVFWKEAFFQIPHAATFNGTVFHNGIFTGSVRRPRQLWDGSRDTTRASHPRIGLWFGCFENQPLGWLRNRKDQFSGKSL